jgi:hypothetical protein
MQIVANWQYILRKINSQNYMLCINTRRKYLSMPLRRMHAPYMIYYYTYVQLHQYYLLLVLHLAFSTLS